MIYPGDYINQVVCADVMDYLSGIPDCTVQTCITSPPYWGLRDYGVDGQLGLEPTPEEYTAKMVEIFEAVRRVLRNDGTLWLNLGDSYCNDSQAGGGDPTIGEINLGGSKQPNMGIAPGLKRKDLVGIPWRVAFALQAAGWYLRSEIVWYKPNPMPESVTDRPTSAHEKIFLLAKSERYYFDADAIKTPPLHPTTKMPDGWDTGSGSHDTIHRNGREKGRKTDKQRGHTRPHAGFADRWDSMTKEEQQQNGANCRNVWTIVTKPFKQAHFATFPVELPERCMLAGSKPGDIVLDPFGGAGTTAFRAKELSRRYLTCDLNPDYCDLSEDRLRQEELF